CAAGQTNTRVARELRLTKQTVGKGRTRFLARRVDGVRDEPRPGVCHRELNKPHLEELKIPHPSFGRRKRNVDGERDRGRDHGSGCHATPGRCRWSGESAGTRFAGCGAVSGGRSPRSRGSWSWTARRSAAVCGRPNGQPIGARGGRARCWLRTRRTY